MADFLFHLLGFSCFAYAKLYTDYKFGQIQTSQTGSQQYSDTSLYKVSESSLD